MRGISRQVLCVGLAASIHAAAGVAEAQTGCETDRATITASRGTIFENATGLAPGDWYWKLVDVAWCDEFSSGGKVNIFYKCLDAAGNPIANQPCIANYGSTYTTIYTKAPPDWGDFPMAGGNWCPAWPEGGNGPYNAWVQGDPSDKVYGMGLPCNRHECYFLTWQRTQYSSPTQGAIAGTVTNTVGQAISGAQVTAEPGGHSTLSGPTGAYSLLDLDPGTYTVTASKSGFNPQTHYGVSVSAGATTTRNFALSSSLALVSGVVRDLAGVPIVLASVRLSPGNYSAVTAADGSYQMIGVSPGTYDVIAFAPSKAEQTVAGQVLAPNGSLVVDFSLAGSGRVAHLLDDFNGSYPGYPALEESFKFGIGNHFFWAETLGDRKLAPHTGTDSAQGFKVAASNDQYISYFETKDTWTGDKWFNLRGYALYVGWEPIDYNQPITYIVYVKGNNPGSEPDATGYYQQLSVHYPTTNYQNNRIDWNGRTSETWQMLRVTSPGLKDTLYTWLTFEMWYPAFYYNGQTASNWMVWDNFMVEYAPLGGVDPVTDFTATASPRRVQLSWQNPADPDFAGTRIRYRTDTYPSGPQDGTLLVDQPGLPGDPGTFAHLNAAAGQTYYYAAFAYSGSGLFSSAVTALAAVPPLAPGDFDGDTDVDQDDFGSFQVCLSGAGNDQNDPDCLGARLDGDTDVDQDDLAIFIGCMSGPGVEANINCAQPG